MTDQHAPADLIAQAATKMGCHAEDIRWWSWPETFSSTAGPRAGVGGQAITWFQVYGFECAGFPVDLDAVLYCAGKWRRWERPLEMRWHR